MSKTRATRPGQTLMARNQIAPHFLRTVIDPKSLRWAACSSAVQLIGGYDLSDMMQAGATTA